MLPVRTDPVTDLILAEEERLRRLAGRLTRCQADADDLVQNTLLRAFRARARFEPGTSIRAWTSTILRRVFLTNMARAKRRRMETDTDAGGPLGFTAGAEPRTAPESTAELTRFFERLEDPVKRALNRLPEIYRTPLLLAVVDDLTHAEIAVKLGVPEGTVMSRTHRARESMKRDLVDFGFIWGDAKLRERWRVISRLATCAFDSETIERQLAV